MAIDMPVREVPTTEDEEKLALEREEREREAAAEELSRPVGGIRPTKFRMQLTGGAIELAPAKAALFEKDTEVSITVAGVELSGWVKTIKHTTEKKGDVAALEAVVVVEDPSSGTQLAFGEGE